MPSRSDSSARAADGQSPSRATNPRPGPCWAALLDSDGATVRAAFVVGPDGAPGFALFEPAGKPRLARREPAPAVVAYEAASVMRPTFGLRRSDAGLELAAARGTPRTVLRVQPDRTPDFVLRDREGRARAELSALPEGTPALNLNGAPGRARHIQSGGAALALVGREGRRRMVGADAVTRPARRPTGPRGLRHVALRSRDLRASERFYVDVLGLRIAFPHRRMLVLEGPGGGDLLNFVATRRAFDAAGGGLDHLGFRVPSTGWRSTMARLRRAGIRIEGRRGRDAVYFRDPNGYTIELYRD